MNVVEQFVQPQLKDRAHFLFFFRLVSEVSDHFHSFKK